MRKKLFMGAVTLFWIAMNVALWRMEYGGSDQSGSKIPMDMVWDKILTAPDGSGLAVTYKGERIGFFRWTPTVKEPAFGGSGASGDNTYVEGMVKEPLGYFVHLEGSLTLPDEESTRIRLEWKLDLKNETDWNEVYFSLDNRRVESGVEMSMKSASEELEFRFGGPRNRTSVTLTRDDLKDPRKMLARFGLSWAAPMLEGLAMNSLTGMAGGSQKLMEKETIQSAARIPLSLALDWEARMDWKHFGSARVRVYRLSARLFEGEEMVLVVSRVGEIIEGSLPGGITFQNDQLLGL